MIYSRHFKKHLEMKNYSYSTQNEKDQEDRTNQFAYQLRDAAMRYMML